MTRLSLGYSPCPNDTFVFHALVHGLLPPPEARGVADLGFEVTLADVDALNRWALEGAGDDAPDVAKVSWAAFGRLADRYVMLPAGGALGRGVGPLIVARDGLASLSGRRVATPGGTTTANLLLDLSREPDFERVEMRYDRIMPAVAAGEVDAGLIIHESRFTYREHGLVELQDLGAWWEGATGLPIPLGGIVAKRSLGPELHARLARALRASVEAAWADPAAGAAYVAEHAQEMRPEVREAHIGLYVNEFSADLGDEGRAAARELLGRAAERGLAPPLPGDALAPTPARDARAPAAGAAETAPGAARDA